MLIFVITLQIFAIGFAQVPELGKCPTLQVMQDFQPVRYYGKWFEITKFYASFEDGMKCQRAWYNPKADGHFWVFNLALDQQDHEKNITGDGYIPDPNEKAKMQVKFDSESAYADYWVLDTDYDNYSLVYACVDVLGRRHLDYAWILSRKTTLDPEVRQRLYKLVDSFGIGSKNFVDDDQVHCYYNNYSAKTN